MNSAELIEQVRVNLTVDAASLSDYTDTVILRELNDQLTTTFERTIAGARSGYWLQLNILTPTVGVSRYRIPARSVGGTLEQVELARGAGNAFDPLPLATSEQTYFYEMASGQTGRPAAYTIVGDFVQLLPTPDSANYTLRLKYYIRPSKLVRAQSDTTTGDAVVRGLITAVNATARTITVNAVPLNQLATGTPALVTGNPIDVVSPDGWHELRLVAAPQTLAGTVFTVTGTQDMSSIAVGDFVRAADQSDWPALPDDFHRPLADLAAAVIAGQIGLDDKKASCVKDAANALSRFQELVTPRTMSDPPTIPLGGGWASPWGQFSTRWRWP